MIRRRTIAFAGVLAASLSVAVFSGVLAAGGSPQDATLLRLVVSAPILYLGLRGLGDSVRVGLAVGSASGVKLALEPLLTTVMLQSDAQMVWLAPLIGDLVYGPIILFAMLRNVRHHPFAIA